MVLNNVKGFDGPYEAPLKLPTRKVLKSWIDYNGHMNLSYYTMAIDNSIDYFLEEILGICETHAKTNDQGPFVVQANFSYLSEMVHKQKFFVQCSLIHFDLKKMHLFLELISPLTNSNSLSLGELFDICIAKASKITKTVTAEKKAKTLRKKLIKTLILVILEIY